MLRFRYRLLVGLCLLLIFTAQAAPVGVARAGGVKQPAGLTMQVTPGYDGFYKLGEWFPVHVVLANDGAGFSGRLQIEAFGQEGSPITTYAQEVDLPSPSRKEITLYSYSTSFQRDFVLRLLQDDRVLMEQPVRLSPVEEPGFIFGVVADDPGLLNVLSGESLGRVDAANNPPWSSTQSNTAALTSVAHMSAANIPPSAAALAGLDGLLFAGADTTRLTPEQLEAIGGWVALGGTLVAAGGPNGTTTLAGLANLLPVRPAGSRQIGEFGGLAGFSGAATTPSGSALASLGEPIAESGAQVLAAEGDMPLVVSRPLGRGQVIFLALDPNVAPLRGWEGTVKLWQGIFADHDVSLSPGGWRRMQQSWGWMSPDTFGSPFDIPSIALPSVWLVGGFLLVYIMVVGPLNYIVLRRLRRPELAWVTIPALILVFAVGAYIFGRESRGANLFLSHGTVIRSYPGAAVAEVSSFIGLFSPDRRSYDVRLGANVEVTEINSSGMGAATGASPATVYQGNPTRLQDLNLNTWALRGFLAEGIIPYNSPYETDLRLENGRLTGTVRNRSQEALEDAAVFSGGSVQQLGRLDPGQQANVDLRLRSGGTIEDLAQQLFPDLPDNNWSSNQTAEEREAQRRASLLSAGLFEDELRMGETVQVGLAGWGASSPVGVEIAGSNPRRDELNLVLTVLPVEIAAGQVELPPGTIKSRVVSGTVDTTAPDGSRLVNLGTAVFAFDIPRGVKVEELALHFEIEMHDSDGVPVAVRNWETNEWDAIEDGGRPLFRQENTAGIVEIGDPAAHASPDGEVQIRLGQGDIYNSTLWLNSFELSATGVK